MFKYASRMILVMAGVVLGGPALMAQGLPNPLNLPDPLGITDSKKGKQDTPQPRPREGHREKRRGHRKEHRDERREHRREHHEDHGDEGRHGD